MTGLLGHQEIMQQVIPQSIEVFLRYPLYKLYYLEDISNFQGLSSEELAAFREYEAPQRSAIMNALKWVSENPDVDLTNVLPDLPFQNNDIHLYIEKVLASLK